VEYQRASFLRLASSLIVSIGSSIRNLPFLTSHGSRNAITSVAITRRIVRITVMAAIITFALITLTGTTMGQSAVTPAVKPTNSQALAAKSRKSKIPTSSRRVSAALASADSSVTGTWIDSFDYIWTLTQSESTISGTVDVGSPCPDPTWPVSGNVTDGGFTITATNPDGGDEFCVTSFTYVMTFTSSGSASGTWTNTSDRSGSVTMSLEEVSYTLTLMELGLGTGTVTDNFSEIKCSEMNGVESGTCSASYPSGTTVLLTASPTSPSTFGAWSVPPCTLVPQSPPAPDQCSVTMNANESVTASFVAPVAFFTLTFSPGTNITQMAINCPNQTSPCTDPNADALTLMIPQVSEEFSLTVMHTEFPATGLCPPGASPSSSFCARFVSFFNYGTDPTTGDTVVPYPYPYANGDGVDYLVYDETPGTEPPTTSYVGPVYWKIGYNNTSFVPPRPYWTGALPRMLDDPDVEEFGPTVPYGTNCSTPMLLNGEPTSPPIYCQFDEDITTFFIPGPGLDPIGGKTPQANDVVVAFLPTSTGTDPVQTPPTPTAPTITGSCINGCVVSDTTITFTEGTGGTFAITTTGFPTPTLTESGALPSGLTFNAATGLISGTPTTAGNYPITLTATNSVSSATLSYTLTVSPLAISPSIVNFGTKYLQQFSFQLVTLTNQGTTPITISSVKVTSPGNALRDYFAFRFCSPYMSSLPGTLGPGKSCQLPVTVLPFLKIFSPTASTATLTITDNAAGSPPPVQMTTEVIDPRATLSTYSLNFGRQKVSTTTTNTVTLTNTGYTPLSLKAIAIRGSAFTFASGTTCANGGTVNPSASCDLNISFTPESKGFFKGQVTITDNAFWSPQVIKLVGTGD
jgi:hypothetical protein